MNTLYQCDEASKGGPTNDTDENKNKLYTYKLGDISHMYVCVNHVPVYRPPWLSCCPQNDNHAHPPHTRA